MGSDNKQSNSLFSLFHKKKIGNLQRIPTKRDELVSIKKEEKLIVPKILVYGIDRMNLDISIKSINTQNFNLDFSSLVTDKKFQDYDGVILFQSTFEIIERVQDYFSSKFNVKYYKEELIKRRNQLSQLLEKGGFVCFLIHRTFVDSSEYGESFMETDLCKIYLNYDNFYRRSLGSEYPITKIYKSEFESFLKDYGNARVEFTYHSSWLKSNMRKICEAQNNLAGFILFNNQYFLSCRLPSKDEVEDFFGKIASSLIATSKKLVQEIPSWVDEYKFKKEEEILREEAVLQGKIEELNSQEEIYKNYKRCLCYDGDLLVESVGYILRNGFGLILNDKEDEHIEDKVLLGTDKNELALIEIKGVNDNIKSQNIYQADSHRGRRNKPSDFPSILIVNTFIKPSNSIMDKMRELNSEQIKLAFEKKVLVMRTVDLLNLLFLKEEGEVKQEEIQDIFTKQYGWLNVSLGEYSIQKE